MLRRLLPDNSVLARLQSLSWDQSSSRRVGLSSANAAQLAIRPGCTQLTPPLRDLGLILVVLILEGASGTARHLLAGPRDLVQSANWMLSYG
jgi:hypothetical protein